MPRSKTGEFPLFNMIESFGIVARLQNNHLSYARVAQTIVEYMLACGR
jgi:hypothetical protein